MTPVWGPRRGVAIEVDAVNSIVAKDVYPPQSSSRSASLAPLGCSRRGSRRAIP